MKRGNKDEMKVCFIAEGSYPYTIGGISSWLNIFMKCFPNYEFNAFAIGAKEKDRGRYSGKIQVNMSKIEEIFLETSIKGKVSRFPAKIIKSSREREVLFNHFSGKYSDWPAIFEFVTKIKSEKLLDFFNCSDFFDIVRSIYDLNYSNAPFNDFLWSIRTMFLYQFYVLQGEPPDADIYHSVSAGFPGIVASKESFFRGKPFLLTEHGIYTREREEEIIKSSLLKDYVKGLWVSYFRSMSMCAYTFADKIVTQFERNREMQIASGADIMKTMIIPNGMSVEEYSFPSQIRLYGDDVVVGAIARIVPIKDIVTMVRAFEKAKLRMPKLKLVVVGPHDEDKEYHAYVMDSVKKRNIQDIIFTGRVDNDTYMLSLHSMDIVLLTSISEGQPLSLLEAMASAKPVIATDVGSCSEIILGPGDSIGAAGIVAPVMDHDAIADAIERLAADAGLRKKFGEAGRQRVERYYTIRHMYECYRNVYEELAGKNFSGKD